MIQDYEVLYEGFKNPQTKFGRGMPSVMLHEAAALPNFRGYKVTGTPFSDARATSLGVPVVILGNRYYMPLEHLNVTKFKITHICFEVDGD